MLFLLTAINNLNLKKCFQREFPAKARELLSQVNTPTTSAGEAKWPENAQTLGQVSEESREPNQKASAAAGTKALIKDQEQVQISCLKAQQPV